MRIVIEHAFFDLNGTLLDPSPIGEPLGGDDEFVAAVLSDAVRLAMIATITESYRDFSVLLEAAAHAWLDEAASCDQSVRRLGEQFAPPAPGCSELG